MKKSFLLFASLLMLFVNVNYANGEDFMSAFQAFAQNVCNSAKKSINLETAQKVAGSNYNIEFTVDKNGDFGNFNVITSTGNKEVDEHLIGVIKAQAHKYSLPSQMAYIQHPIKLNMKGNFEQLSESDWENYTNKLQTEVFKNSDTIASWAEKAETKLSNGAYTIYIDKNGLFYNVKVAKSTGDTNFDTQMINLIKSKSGIIPLPENCKMDMQTYTITIDFD